MAGKRKDKEPTDAPATRYDDELLSAGWNPVIALLEWSCAKTLEHAAREPEPEVREDDVDAFLGRIRTSGN